MPSMVAGAEIYPSACHGRKAYFTGIVIAFILMAAIYFCCETYLFVDPTYWPHFHIMSDRLAFTLRYLSCGVLLVCLFFISFQITRLFNHGDTDRERANVRTIRSYKVYVYSVEQFVFTAFNQLIMSTYLSQEGMKWIILVNIYYVTGNITFWYGYIVSPYFRSLGFTLAFTPSLAMTFCNFYFLVEDGFVYNLETLPEVAPSTEL